VTPLLFVAVCIAGGLGAAARYLVDSWLWRPGRRLPIGLIAVNATGSLLLGVVVALGRLTVLDDAITVVLGAGLLGGYTTFSAASLETVRLVLDRRWTAAAVVGPGMLVLCVALAALGLAATTGLVTALSPTAG